MTNASAGQTAAELFRKWQAFHGDPASATSLVASAAPEVAGPLRRLIDDYFTSQPTDVQWTGEPPEAEPLPVIPGYTILERLGRGGMGEVFRVRDALDREHALKVARRRQLSAAGRERFWTEARAMAKLDHPHVVRVGHYGDLGGRPYFEMDLFPANLADRPGDHADPRAAVRLMAQVADGVGHLHARGFVHRDLKPSNILLTADGRPVVSDFGLIKGPTDGEAAAADSGACGSVDTHATGARGSQTVAGMVLGTRRYMAPDQAAGLNHQAGPAWDVWALGVMLHELLTGQPPRSSAAPERLLDPAEPDNPPPTRVKPDLDPRLGRIVEKCLARDPAVRYPTGAAVAADLNRWLHRRRRQWTTAAAAGLLVLLVGGIITAAMTWPRRPAEPTRDQILADIQKDLRDGRAVELIGETGMPRWFEVVTSGGDKPFASDANGTMQVNAGEVTLVDLPPTGLERYRFEVQVQQHGNSLPGLTGIYAGRHVLPSGHGPIDCFAALWFNEQTQFQIPPNPTSPSELGVRYHRRAPVVGSVIGGYGLGTGPAVPAAGLDKFWRAISVDVGPDRMTWSFEGKAAGTVILPLAPEHENVFGRSAELLPGARTDFLPSGGYGLVVNQGKAAFRNARLTPLDH